MNKQKMESFSLLADNFLPDFSTTEQLSSKSPLPLLMILDVMKMFSCDWIIVSIAANVTDVTIGRKQQRS